MALTQPLLETDVDIELEDTVEAQLRAKLHETYDAAGPVQGGSTG